MFQNESLFKKKYLLLSDLEYNRKRELLAFWSITLHRHTLVIVNKKQRII